MDRIVNYLFILLLTFLFVVEADTGDQLLILYSLAGAFLFCLLAFLFKWLTLDGAVAAAVVGTYTLGIGGLPMTALLLTFFITGVIITGKRSIHRGEGDHDTVYREKQRRNGLQVWANSFWFILAVTLAFLWNSHLFQLAAAGALATANSDTWATELGSARFGGSTFLMNDMTHVKPGTEGGVSVSGTLAALGGSLLMGGAAYLVFPFGNLNVFLIITLAGFLGCFTDSYLGATFQRRDIRFSLALPFFSDDFRVDNNVVNWFATGVGSVVALTLNLLIL